MSEKIRAFEVQFQDPPAATVAGSASGRTAVPGQSWLQLLRRIGLRAFLVRGFRRVFYGPVFSLFESCGIHVLPADYGSPVPDTRSLRKRLPQWYRPSEMPGIDMRVAEQVGLLRSLRKYHTEAFALPAEKELVNGGIGLGFGELEAHILYAMVRHARPELIVEVGSGVSSFYSNLALKKNETGSLLCIEPHPLAPFEAFAREEEIRLLPQPAESLDLSFFTKLKENDILFIDSSHILRLGSDVWYLYLEILPRLRPGVLVHIHDISFPFPSPDPDEWIFKRHQFWNEAGLLQALLCGNSHLQVILCSSLLAHEEGDELKHAFPIYDPALHKPASIWIRVV